jgi:hypothetical protein
MIDMKSLPSDKPLHQVEKTVRLQNRQPAAVVADAVAKCLERSRTDGNMPGATRSERGQKALAKTPLTISEVRHKKNAQAE